MPLPNYPYAGKDTLTKNDILETLQHWITVMQLKPGEKISDTEIAEYFNVSRTPVREVLKMLEQQKLIFTYPGRATIVADLALDDIESYYLPMQTLQCLAVRLAVCSLALPEDANCPLIIDDALVNYDAGRRKQTMALLEQIARRRQVILFTCS